MLLALANPRFSELRMRTNSGNISATSSGVPSLDALSTTITSSQELRQCSRNDSRHSITYFLAFHTTITTETLGRAAWDSADNTGNGESSVLIVFKILFSSYVLPLGSSNPTSEGLHLRQEPRNPVHRKNARAACQPGRQKRTATSPVHKDGTRTRRRGLFLLRRARSCSADRTPPSSRF